MNKYLFIGNGQILCISFCFFLIPVVVLIVPVGVIYVLNKLLKKRLRNKFIRRSLAIIIGISLTLYGYSLLTDYLIFSPSATVSINADYYFTQRYYQLNMGGEDFYFYKKRKLWFDKQIGHIFWDQGGGGDVTFKAQNQSKNTEIIITNNGEIFLDTLLNLNKKFDFEIGIQPVKKK